MTKSWCYDIEQFTNFHSLVAKDINTGEFVSFVVHELQDDRRNYVKWLLNEVDLMIGYNNINYDYTFIEFILKDPVYFVTTPIDKLLIELKELSDSNIARDFSRSIRHKFLIRQIDLYRIWHFDNKNKATSLKWLEFAMNYENIEDLPYSPKKVVTNNKQIRRIVEYNKNDVDATYRFYNVTIGNTDMSLYKGKDKLFLRQTLSDLYSIDFLNANDPKIGSDLILSLYCNKTNKSKGKVLNLRTYRPSIAIKDCIFKYIFFQTPEFNSILEFFNNTTITDTKKVFDNIKVSTNLLKYCSKHKDYYDHKSKKIKKLNVTFKGVDFIYGTGGIHGSRKGIFKEDDEWVILDADVTSLYPYIAIKNRLYPEHLGIEYIDVYEHDIVQKRVDAKANISNAYVSGVKPNPEDEVITEGLKLSANGSYGKTNDENSFLYDPFYTMSVTINGQLMLSMLAESLHLAIPNMILLQINTDGLSVKIKRSDVDLYYSICKQWEKITNLSLEYADYSKMIISNVNNYIAVTVKGKIKYKGWFEIDKEVHKNSSSRIIPIALSNYFVKGIPIDETINNHTNIFDFCIGVKRKRSPAKGRSIYYHNYVDSNNNFVSEKIKSKVVRYYISKTGGTLVKKYSDNSNQFVDVGYISTIFNKAIFKDDFNDYDVNKKFYIKKCNDIINDIDPFINQLTLF